MYSYSQYFAFGDNITSLLMRKTLEADSYRRVPGLYGLEAGNKIATVDWDNLRIANNAVFWY